MSENLDIANPKLFNKYIDASLGMTKVLFVEGYLDSLFYSKFKETFSFVLHYDSSGVSDLLRLHGEHENSYAIIDRDYTESYNIPRVYCIDFYSIENIILKHHKLFDNLKKRLEKINLSYFINRDYIYNIEVFIDDQDGINILRGTTIHEQYKSYILKKINDNDKFLKYFNLKKIVNAFKKKTARKNKKLSKLFHVLDLYEGESFASIYDLFDTRTVEKMIEDKTFL